MTEIEPVAYLNKHSDGSFDVTMASFTFSESAVPFKPLYTKEQLQPRVEMTKVQLDEFMSVKATSLTFYDFWQQALEIESNGNSISDLSEEELMLAWLDPDCIDEINPVKKWFVRSKEPGENDYYSFLQNTVQLELNWCYGKDKDKPLKIAQHFDTKEEAEEWKNPLTEAVLLPVEE